MPLGYGVIGSPTGSGPVSLGSSPGTPASSPDSADVPTSALVRLGSGERRIGLTGTEAVVCALPVIPDPKPDRIACRRECSAPSSRGLGRRPLKAVTPVRIRSGLRYESPRNPHRVRGFFLSAPAPSAPGPPAPGLSAPVQSAPGPRLPPKPGPRLSLPTRTTRHQPSLAANQ